MFRLLIMFSLSVTLWAQENPVYRVLGTPERIYDGQNQGIAAMRPVYHPDGQSVSFTTDQNNGIWLLDLKSGRVSQITDAPGAGFGYQWSTDGEEVLARVARFQGFYRYDALKIFNRRTGEERQITTFHTGMNGFPHWTADELHAGIAERSSWKLYPTGRTASKSQKSISRPVLFMRNGGIARGSAELGTFEMISNRTDEQCLNLHVSPDGRKVVFEVLGANLAVMDVDGSHRQDLGRGHRPMWAPDSRFITYMVTTDDGHQYLSADIEIVSIDGSSRIPVTSGSPQLEMNPCWSPDGRYIVYDVLGEGSLYRVQVTK